MATTLLGHPAFPFLIVATYTFKVKDDSGLPSKQQYTHISRFEQEIFDEIEKREIGINVLCITNAGNIKYLLYVRSIEEAADFVNSKFGKQDKVDVSAKEDPGWSEYRAIVQKLSHQQTIHKPDSSKH